MTDARALQKTLVLLVPALLFGLVVAAQWRTFTGPASRDLAIRYTEPLNATVARLQEQQDALKAQLTDLRAKLSDVQHAAATQSDAAKDLQARIDALGADAGVGPARGEGLVITLDDPSRPATSEPPERPTCHAHDLIDIANAAWRGGARAVAINDERLVASSSVYCVGATIVVNGSVLSAPFDIVAVGPVSSLRAAFDDPAQLRDLRRRSAQQAVVFRVTTPAVVEAPAYNGPLAVRSARPR